MDADSGVGGGTRVDLGIGLLADGGDNDRETFGACSIEQQEGEAAIAGYEPEDGIARSHPDAMLLYLIGKNRINNAIMSAPPR